MRSRVRQRFVSALPYLAPLFVGLTLATLPFLLYGPHPLGYDTGFYMRYTSQPLVSIPNSAVPGLDHTVIVPRILLDLVGLLSFGSAGTLYATLAAAFALVAVAATYLAQTLATASRAALWSGLLVATSPVLYLAYQHVLLKNLLALVLLFVALRALHTRHLVLATISLLAIVPTHQSTTILALIALATYGALRFLKGHPVHTEILLWGATAACYTYLHPHVAAKIAAPPTGVFIEPLTFVLLSAPLIVLIALRAHLVWHVLRKNETILALLIMGIAFPLLHLPYAERVLLLLGVTLALVAGVCVADLWTSGTRTRAVLFTLLALHGASLAAMVYHTPPLLPRDLVPDIVGLHAIIPDHATVLTVPHLLPWVHGWTTAQVYAPGMLKDGTSAESWGQYYAHTDPTYDRQFLARYPSPLYFVVDRSTATLLLPHGCTKALGPLVYQYTCANRGPYAQDTSNIR